jgi:nitrogen fixation-related uncharacterized protein
MTYYLAWLLLMIVGLVVSVLLFMWAFQTGQFSDQTRARYLPLVGERLAAEGEGRIGRERYALMVLAASAVCVFIATFVVAIMNR